MASDRRAFVQHAVLFIFQEAAIYLQEGENNDKFYTHPGSHDALPAYQIAHNRWFHMLDLGAAVLVLLLAACERPAVDFLKLPVGVSSFKILVFFMLLAYLFRRKS